MSAPKLKLRKGKSASTRMGSSSSNESVPKSPASSVADTAAGELRRGKSNDSPMVAIPCPECGVPLKLEPGADLNSLSCPVCDAEIKSAGAEFLAGNGPSLPEGVEDGVQLPEIDSTDEPPPLPKASGGGEPPPLATRSTAPMPKEGGQARDKAKKTWGWGVAAVLLIGLGYWYFVVSPKTSGGDKPEVEVVSGSGGESTTVPPKRDPKAVEAERRADEAKQQAEAAAMELAEAEAKKAEEAAVVKELAEAEEARQQAAAEKKRGEIGRKEERLRGIATEIAAIDSGLAAIYARRGEWAGRLQELREAHRTTVEAAITIDLIASEAGIRITGQSRSREATLAEIERQVTERVDKQVAKVDLNAVRQSAEQQYSLWKIRDRVDIVDARGRTHRGGVFEVSPQRMNIGGVAISGRDFSEEMKIRTDPEYRKQAIKKLLDTATEGNKARRAAAEKKIRPDLESAIYRESGFVEIEGHWRDQASVKTHLERMRTMRIQREFDDGLADYLRKNNFTKIENEWVPIEVAKEAETKLVRKQKLETEAAAATEWIRQEKERLEREKRERELAEKQRVERELAERRRRERVEAERLEAERERRMSAAARVAATREIPACIDGLLKEQSIGNDGGSYWVLGVAQITLFAPTQWEIKGTNISGTSASVSVLVDSSTKVGIQVRRLWRFRMRYLGEWKVSEITEM